MLWGRIEGRRQGNGIGFILSFDEWGFSPVKTSVPLLCTFALSCEVVFNGLWRQDACSNGLLYQQAHFAIAVLSGVCSLQHPALPRPQISTILSPSLHICAQAFPYQVGLSWAPHPNSSSIHHSSSLTLISLHSTYSSQTALGCTSAIYAIICPKTLYIIFADLCVFKFHEIRSVSVLFPRVYTSPIK